MLVFLYALILVGLVYAVCFAIATVRCTRALAKGDDFRTTLPHWIVQGPSLATPWRAFMYYSGRHVA